jgi:hypothetical protein
MNSSSVSQGIRNTGSYVEPALATAEVEYIFALFKLPNRRIDQDLQNGDRKVFRDVYLIAVRLVSD